jgi:hypothetical protein
VTQSQGQTTSYDGWIGRDAYDSTGEKVGEITDIYYDDATGRPEWVGVKTGMFGSKTSFVPIHGSQLHSGTDKNDEDSLRLAFDKAMIKDSPRIDPDGQHLTPDDERELWSYWGYNYEADPKLKTYGYGPAYTKNRADKDYQFRRYDNTQQDWSEERRLEEHTEEVPVQATVEVPINTTVRLRKYQTQKDHTETRTVQVPVTETEEHVEVADVEAKGNIGKATVTTSSGDKDRNR